MVDLQEVLRMGSADAPTSYAANSNIQWNVIAKAKPMVEDSVEQICSTVLPAGQQLVVADLGCSYGPNAFSLISEVMDAVAESCRKLHRGTLREVQFFLNDLPANDFNDVFRSLAPYKKKFKEDKGDELTGRFYVAGVPGNFYERLFPSRTVHLFHSSCCLHWLSQVPEGLKDEHGNELNKGNIYVSETSPPCVREAYLRQFQKDLDAFLQCRSEEIQDGGLMVLTLFVRPSPHPHTGSYFFVGRLTSEAISSMADEGMINEADIDSFNLPIYIPCVEEVQGVVNGQGAFQIVKELVMELDNEGVIDDDDAACGRPSECVIGRGIAKMLRTTVGTLLESHIRDEKIVDEIFTRLASNLTREYEKGKEVKSRFYVVTMKRNNAS